jgi:hypothetical protein
MFTVRTIHLREQRVETAQYDASATSSDADPAGTLWADFIRRREPAFREKLPFLKEVELEWSAAPGGVVLASTHVAAGPCSMGILLTGSDSEAEELMLEAWRKNVLTPLMGSDEAAQVEAPERPLLVNVMCPAAGENAMALRLTAAALASAYLRARS